MLAYLQTLLSFAAVCVLAAAAARRWRLPSALMPLPVVCGVMVLLVLGGYAGFLRPAGAVVLCLAAAALGWMLVTRRQGGFARLFSPGFLLFCVGGVAFITLFAVRQPLPQEWDEFSLWAVAARLTKEQNVIYNAAPMGWAWWPQSQKPGLPTLSYFFNYFGTFAAWRMYAAYAVLYVAVWATLLGTLRKKHWQLAIAAALLGFLLPYFLVYQRDIYCNFTYLSAYADVPMGMLAGGMLAWYFYAKSTANASECGQQRVPLWPLLWMTAALALCKETGLALSCIVAAVVFADSLFAGTEEKPFAPRALGKKTGLFLGMVAAAGGTFVLSARFLATLGAAQGSVSSTAEMGYGAMLLEGGKLLLGLAPGAAGAPFAEKFALIRNEMISLFLPGELHEVTMVGCGFYVLLLVWGILIVTALFTNDKKHRRSALLYGVFSTLGFFLYYTFIGFTYVFVFQFPGTQSIVDYNRYFGTYYVAWLAGALALLILGARLGSRKKNLLTLGTFVVSLCFLLRFGQLVQPQLCVIDYADVVYDDTRALQARADAAAEQMKQGDKVYYINSKDDGSGWFRTSYALLPYMLMYSHGGGNFADANAVLQAQRDANAEVVSFYGGNMTMQEWAAELALQNCDYVYLDDTNDDFWRGYSMLFSDGGEAARSKKTLLYRVEITGKPQYMPLSPADTVPLSALSDTVRVTKELDENGAVLPNYKGLSQEARRQKMVNAAQCLTLTPVEMEVPAE